MVFWRKKNKKTEKTQTKEPNPIEILRQEKQDLERRLEQAQEEKNQAEEQLAEVKGEYDKLEKIQKSIFKTAEAQVKKEVEEVKKELEAKYQAKIADLDEERKKLNIELGRKFDELSKQKREHREKMGERVAKIQQYEEQISKLKEDLINAEEAVTKKYSRIEQKIKEIAKKKTVTILGEGEITTVTIYEQVYEGRRSSGYNALGPNGEKIYVRTARHLPIGDDISVIIRAMPHGEARPMENPDVELKVDEVFEVKAFERARDKNDNSLITRCKNGRLYILNVGSLHKYDGKVRVFKKADNRDIYFANILA